ncbi:hypothetical protein GOODEAATRI_004988 [Goodea atripinnis]|uniref:Uncharacterized protein n=1 Tax=Goodea atripinnis TaxID=208336 RepID=A0ABV0PKY5_9TELE
MVYLSVGGAHFSVARCRDQVPRVLAADPSQLTSGEMAERDGSDTSPPESQGSPPNHISNHCPRFLVLGGSQEPHVQFFLAPPVTSASLCPST